MCMATSLKNSKVNYINYCLYFFTCVCVMGYSVVPGLAITSILAHISLHSITAWGVGGRALYAAARSVPESLPRTCETAKATCSLALSIF